MVLESELDDFILNPKFNLSVAPKMNIHNQTIIDTIKTRSFGNNRIYSYKSKNKEWVYSAKIRSSEFEFLEAIKIGIKKETFERIIKLELKSDLIKIGNLEQTSVFVFSFKDNRLMAIDYSGYVD